MPNLTYQFDRLPVGSLECSGVADIHYTEHVNESGCWQFWRVESYAVAASRDLKGDIWEPDPVALKAALYSGRRGEIYAAIKAAHP
jgi:hypothetical protein